MKAKETLTNQPEEHKGGFVYFNDDGQEVELSTIRENMYTISDILFACQGEMDDFIEIGCGNGIYQGNFMLVKFGLEQVMSMISKMTPTTD